MENQKVFQLKKKPKTIDFLLIWAVLILATIILNALPILSESESYLKLQLVVLLFFSISFIVSDFRLNKTFLSPSILTTFFFFILSNSILLLLLRYKSTFLSFEFQFSGDPYLPLLNKAASFTLLAALAFRLGYTSKTSQYFSNFLAKKLRFLLRKEFDLNKYAVRIIYGIVILTRLYLISQGLYGYLQDAKKNIAAANYTQYLGYIEALGSFIYLLICIQFFKKTQDKGRLIFYSVVVIELFFALISGLKFNVLRIPATIGISYYLVFKRIRKRYILYSILALVFAYGIIEPFRYMANNDYFKNATDISDVINVYTTVYTVSKEIENNKTGEESSLLQNVFSRSEILSWSALVIWYKDNKGLKDKDPNFFWDTVLSPVYAIVPRFILPFKPLNSYGAFVTQIIQTHGEDTQFDPEAKSTSIGMGPVGFLYLAGGVPFIFIGFYLLGIVESVIFRIFYLSNTWGGLLIYLSIVLNFMSVDSVFYAIFIGLIRVIIGMLFIQHIFLRR